MTEPTDPSTSGTGGTAAAVPDHAVRQILKATLVPLTVDAPLGGLAKATHAYVRQLGVQPGEVAAARRFADDGHPPRADVNWGLLAAFDTAQVPSQLPSAADFSAVPAAGLRAFGELLQQLRAASPALAAPSPYSPRTSADQPAPPHPATADAAVARILLNRAVIANASYDLSSAPRVCPLGMLNLERMEMAPAGIERGELVATIPLAPGEKTAVTQTEWSVTSQEFTSIVTDSLENVSQTGVTDNTELAQSTTSQLQHANQFNVTGTVSGGISLISGSADSGFTAQDSSSQSATDSRKHAVSVTQTASSRTKQEHKVTISTTTVSGTSEVTSRTLHNASATDPIRIDYFSMMRKWRVRLYRYGLRMTYDLVVPEPAGAMRAAYAELAGLQDKLGPFVFNVSRSEITTDVWPGESQPHYLVLADRYGAQVPAPPGPVPTLTVPGPTDGLADDNDDWHFYTVSFTVPDGYQVDHIQLTARLNTNSKGNDDNGGRHTFHVMGSDFGVVESAIDYDLTLTTGGGAGSFMAGYTGQQNLTYFVQYSSTATIMFTVHTAPTGNALQDWSADVWGALYNAAQTQYYAAQQDYSTRSAALQDSLDSVDTLTLRREESDEVMKSALRWLSSDFNVMPADVVQAFKDSGDDLRHGVGFTGSGDVGAAGAEPGPDQGALGISAEDWTAVAAHEDEVRFINQAIEWENVVTFLYSYFWDIPESWDFIRRIKHPDATRQAFLRAGGARVVLTIRKGWEEAWITFLATGRIDGSVADHPYLPVAQEIAAYDDRNYPGIPPANPGGAVSLPADAVAAACDARIAPDPAGGPVTVPVDSSAGFLVGAAVVIDGVGDPNVQESQQITAVPDATHIVVAALTHPHDGTGTPFAVVQPGEKGALIAEWAEYTPTSGTDIAVTSDLTTVI